MLTLYPNKFIYINWSIAILLGYSNISYANDIGLLYEDPPVVLTPTRLKQSLADTPSSVTVIDKHTIKALGARTVTDILRLTPGIGIQQKTGNDIRVTYHSGHRNPRRLQVLIDGVSIYQNGIANVDWAAIPITIEEIEKIEIIRSPSTATYGANAFNGVINIITKTASTDTDLHAKYAIASLDVRDILLSYGDTIDNSVYKITLSEQQSSGNDYIDSDENPPINRDDLSNQRVNFKFLTTLGASTEFDLAIHHNKTEKQISRELGRYTLINFPDISKSQQIYTTNLSHDLSNNQNIKFRLSNYEIEQQQEWNTCVPILALTKELKLLLDSDISYKDDIESGTLIPKKPEDIPLINALLLKIAELGGLSQAFTTETCGHVNENIDEHRINAELQYQYVLSDTLRFVSVLGYTDSQANSETFFDGKMSNQTNYALTNVEYKPIAPVTINAGFMWEDDKYLDNEFSPRAAINYHLNRQHTLRFIYSEAIRSADLFEQSADWQYFVRDLSIPVNDSNSAFFALQVEAKGGLKPEKIVAKEISYYANFKEYGLDWDLKFFREDSSQLISEGFDETFNFVELGNDHSSQMKGVELEVGYQPSHRFSSRFSYAYMDTDINGPRKIRKIEEQISIRRTVSALLSYQFHSDWQASLSYFQTDGFTDITGVGNLRDIHFILNNEHAITEKIKLLSTLKLTHYFEDNSFDNTDIYKDSFHYYLGLNLIIETN